MASSHKDFWAPQKLVPIFHLSTSYLAPIQPRPFAHVPLVRLLI